MFKFLSGYKTHILSATGVIVSGLVATGYLSFEIGAAIGAIVGFAIPSALRDGYKAEVQKAVQALANPQPPA